ncbi:HesA/MoeB/ThiF family protein [uncultured Cohaesibacter sp.]|uniref:HesA/MoeB/ThiF family protein n=1 Tax=uncultured Cohaesibacter sp. TaxID=1002546 RepID=UPI0029C8F411|nr:HesA/MoeB/ThiF family protein [uncultured Cohaesibacter sp.]
MNGHERLRYARNMALPEIGLAGQEALLASSVLVIGAGGLGSPLLFYLAAVGVGHLGIVDDDQVSLSNLQRQILHATSDLDSPKVLSARDTLLRLNPGLQITPFCERLDDTNAALLIAGYDLVVVASDNFKARTIANRICLDQAKPMLTAAVSQFSGQIYAFKPYLGGPCYQCVFPTLHTLMMSATPPASDKPHSGDGILGSVAGVVGSWLATEAIKELLQIGESLAGQMLFIEALSNTVRKMKIPSNPACPCCGRTAKT